jgi:hypothetical protein
MKKLLCGLAVLPLLSTVALAQPADTGAAAMRLNDNQMDSVTAGFQFRETEISNTSWTQVSVGVPNGNPVTACTACFLIIQNPSLSIESAFGISPIATP